MSSSYALGFGQYSACQVTYPKGARLSGLSELSVLFIVSSKKKAEIVSRELVHRFFKSVHMDIAGTEEEFAGLLAHRDYDVILADFAMRESELALTLAAKHAPEVPFIFIGKLIRKDKIIGLVQQGATDYVLSNRLGRLPFAVQQAIRNAKLHSDKKLVEDELAFSLKHLEKAQHLAKIGSFEFNTATRRMIWSYELYGLLGLDNHNVLPSPESAFTVLEGFDWKSLAVRLTGTINSAAAVDETYSFVHPKTGRRYLRLCAQAGKDERTDAPIIIGLLQDITDAKAAEEQTHRHLLFEQDVIALTRDFINTPFDKIDGAISEALRRVGEYCGTGWMGVYQFNNHEFVAAQRYSWQRHASADEALPVLLPLSAFHDSSRRAFYPIAPVEQVGCSFYAYPVAEDGEAWGALVCDAEPNCMSCLDNGMIGVFCEMLIAVLKRRERGMMLKSMSDNSQLILDSISDGFCLIDEDGTIRNLSKGLACWFGRTAAECIGKKLEECLAEEDDVALKETRLAHLSNVFRTGQPVEFDDAKDDRWFHNHYVPVYIDGRLAAAAMFSTNITAKKTAEEKQRQVEQLEKEAQLLRQKEKEYLEILDGSTMGSWIYDVQSGIMKYSDQWLQRLNLGNQLTEPIEAYCDELLHPDDKVNAIEESLRMLSSGQPKFKAEYRIKTNSGYMWVLAQGKIVFDDNRMPLKIYGASIDITERKKAEEALRESKTLLSMLIEGVSDFIYLKDRQSRMVTINPTMASFFNRPPGEILGKNDLDLLADRKQARMILANDRRIMKTGQEEMLEEYVGDRVFLSKKAPWHDAGGKIIGLVCISRDITERMDLMKRLQATADELKRKNELITDFFINISHEFKTPISIMMISAELIEQCLEQDSPDIKSVCHNVAYIRQNIFRLSRLVNNLLDITKVDAGFMQPTLLSKDIAQLLQYLVQSLQPYARKKQVAISYAGPREKVMMPTDTGIIDRIILNLVSNALKHTPQGGRISVNLQWLGNGARITVRDNGAGIPKSKQEIIFDRFRQVNTSLARSSEGCGIGLALVRSLSHMLGGRVWVDSEPGCGSEFFVELPVLQESCQTEIEVQGLPLYERIEMELSDIV